MWWILTVLITAPLVAMAAGLTKFSPNTVISSTDVNNNFQSLSDRITALESAKTVTTLVMDAAPGPLPIPATGAAPVSFTTSGGPVLILVSGSAYGPIGFIGVAVQIDGAPIGQLRLYTNEASSHKTFPLRTFKPTLAAGAHNVQLVATATSTVADTGDLFSVTVIEFPH
jgi:hypothetical protein